MIAAARERGRRAPVRASDEWSLGMLARISGAVVTGEDDDDVRFVHAVGTSPSLLFAATYN